MVGNSYERPLTLRCNGCGAYYLPDEGDDADGQELPPGWVVFTMVGWVGEFHACSPVCRTRVEGRSVRPEPTSTPPPAETIPAPPDDDGGDDQQGGG